MEENEGNIDSLVKRNHPITKLHRFSELDFMPN